MQKMENWRLRCTGEYQSLVGAAFKEPYRWSELKCHSAIISLNYEQFNHWDSMINSSFSGTNHCVPVTWQSHHVQFSHELSKQRPSRINSKQNQWIKSCIDHYSLSQGSASSTVDSSTNSGHKMHQPLFIPDSETDLHDHSQMLQCQKIMPLSKVQTPFGRLGWS